jgi:hypothetical protein
MTRLARFCGYRLRGAGTSVQVPCATSAAMPIVSPSVGCGWMVLADIDRVAAHFDGQADFADHVAGVRADNAPPMTRCVSASKISLVKP